MTKREAQAWKRRWAAVNEREHKELRRTPAEEKLRQLNVLVNSARAMGWSDDAPTDMVLHRRWMRLRKKLGA
ncbi:MAG: hypothetical protein ACRD44_12440 [Bryobacteraceae bacterium]